MAATGLPDGELTSIVTDALLEVESTLKGDRAQRLIVEDARVVRD